MDDRWIDDRREGKRYERGDEVDAERHVEKGGSRRQKAREAENVQKLQDGG